MAEIGETLREARMRARIDISEIESQTKIRAKYLRAIENEEWDLLPGPTYVKSFLRTYAEALGLDARQLVEEYKVRHERLSDEQMNPIAPRGTARQPPPRRGPSPLWVVGVIVAGLVVALWLLGQGDDDPGAPVTTTTPVAETRPSTAPRETSTTPRDTPPARPTRVRLQIIPMADVYVCLVAGDRVLVNGETLRAGQPTEVFTSRRFRLNLGNSNARLRINDTVRPVPASSTAIGYTITRDGRRDLPAGQRPDCT